MTRNIFYLYPFLFLTAEASLTDPFVEDASSRSPERARAQDKLFAHMGGYTSPEIHDELRAFVEKILNPFESNEIAESYFIRFVANLKCKSIDKQRFLLQYICALMTPEQTFCAKARITQSFLFVYGNISAENLFYELFEYLKPSQSSQYAQTIAFQIDERRMRSAFFSRESQIYMLEHLSKVNVDAIESSFIDLIHFVQDPHFFKNPYVPTCQQLTNLFIKKNSAPLVMTSEIFFDILNKLIGMRQVGNAFDYIDAALLSFSQGSGNLDFYLQKIDEISRITYSPEPAFAAYACALAQINETDYEQFKELIVKIESPRSSDENLPLSFCNTLKKNKYKFDLIQSLSNFGIVFNPAAAPSNPLTHPQAAPKRPQICIRNSNTSETYHENHATGNYSRSAGPQIAGVRGLQFSSALASSSVLASSSAASSSSAKDSQPRAAIVPISIDGEAPFFQMFAEITPENASEFKEANEKFVSDAIVVFKEYFKKKDAQRHSCCFCFLSNDEIVKKFIKRCTYLRQNKDVLAHFNARIADFLKTHAQ
ncbi:MAG: hypothetical protein NEHIOOID_01060 [Holosporales bacterium]